jgi:hypothetical protein
MRYAQTSDIIMHFVNLVAKHAQHLESYKLDGGALTGAS